MVSMVTSTTSNTKYHEHLANDGKCDMDKHQDDATIVILGMEHQRELYHLGLVNASHPQISKSAVAVLGSFWDGFLDPEKNMKRLGYPHLNSDLW